MPIYEYTCSGCGKRFEQLRDMHDASPSICPDCGKSGERVIASRTSVIGGRDSGAHPPCCGGEERCGNSSGCGHRGACGCGGM